MGGLGHARRLASRPAAGLAAWLVASIALVVTACSRAPGPPVPAAAPAAAGQTAQAAGATGLRLLGADPPSGSLVEPNSRFLLIFDRPIDLSSVTRSSAAFEYPDPQAVFIVDPFRLTSSWLEAGGTVLALEPPDMLTGREVRLTLHESLRGADGSPLAPDPSAPPGAAHVLSWRVLELPPP